MIRVLVALVLGAVVTFGATRALDAAEQQVRAALFAERTERVLEGAELRADILHRLVEAMGLYAERRPVTGEALTPYLSALRASHDGFRATAWLPVVTDRPTFEAQVNAISPGFEITEVTPEGEVVRAGNARAWVPFLLVQPPIGNQMLRGLDIGNQQALAETMQRAHLRGVAMAPAQRFPGSEDPSFLLLRYVPDPESFMAVLLSSQALFDHLLDDRPDGLTARLTDQTVHEVVLEEAGFDASRAQLRQINLAGRNLVLEVAPAPGYAPITLPGRQGILAAGAGLTLMLVALVLLGAPQGTR